MAYGDKLEFRPGAAEVVVYSDGTEIPHLPIEVLQNGSYIGYIEVHLHRVKDGSISVGVTSRFPTTAKP